MQSLDRKRLVVLLLILYLGLFLRIYGLGSESMWHDEINSINTANLDFFGIIEKHLYHGHPPLHYVLLHYWIDLFGDSEISTRFLSAIFGFLALFMVYKVGSVLFDKETGILGSLLLGLCVFQIRYSQEVRMYSLMVLLTSFSFYFFIQVLKRKKTIDLVGYILSSSLLIYTHGFSFFLIIAQNIYFTISLLSRKTLKLGLKKWILLQVTLIVLCIPRLSVLINLTRAVGEIKSASWIPVPSLHSIVVSFVQYSGSRSLLLLFVVLSCFSVITFKTTKAGISEGYSSPYIQSHLPSTSLPHPRRIYLLLVWLFTPIVLPFIVSVLLVPIYWTRYTIGGSLAFYLLVAKGLRNIPYRYAKLAVIGTIVVLSLVNVRTYYMETNKDQWRDVASYLDENARYEDLLLFNEGFGYLVFNYYSQRTDLIKVTLPQEYAQLNDESIRELELIARRHPRIWLIRAYSTDEEKVVEKTLSESHALSSYNRYHDPTAKDHLGWWPVEWLAIGWPVEIDVYLFERINDAESQPL